MSLADQERKRSVPKKGVKHGPPGQTHGISLLPYHSNTSLTTSWSITDFGCATNAFQGCVVLKFGGSSMGAKLRQVVDVVSRQASEGSVAVVVSAMGKSTDHLIDAADRACLSQLEEAQEKVRAIRDIALNNVATVCPDEPMQRPIRQRIEALLSELQNLLLGISLVRELSPATLDRLLSFGERLSATVLAFALTAYGTPAHFIDGGDVIATDEDFGKARVEWEDTQRKLSQAQDAWPESSVPIVTGFLGATEDGRRTTLGRNGSDYTAALLGLFLGASRVVINTDVPGVFTADPHIVKEAYPVARLSYVEAMELSIYGSRMFHPRTILPLVDMRIPMVIRNTDDPDGPATVISDPVAPGAPAKHGNGDISNGAAGGASGAATCVTHLEHLAVITTRSRLGHSGTPAQHIGLRCCSALDGAEVKIHHASYAAHGQAVHVVVSESQVAAARSALLEEFEREVRRRELDELNVWQPVTLLTLVRASQAVLPKFFAGLTAAKVRIRAIGQGSDSTSVSCVIDSHDTAVAVRCAHTAINLGHQIVSLLVLGSNPSSLGLLRRIQQQSREILERYKVELRVVGTLHTCGSNPIAGDSTAPSGLVEEGVDIAAKLEEMERTPCVETPPSGKRMSSVVPIRMLQRLRQMSCPVVVDCNRLELDVGRFYESCGHHGIHVVVSSAASIARIGGACPLEPETGFLTYDNSVGASVPIGDTIRRLNQMGDRVTRVDGALSGTCNFIAAAVNSGVPLSEAAGRAIGKSYSEANVAADLSGLDTARKLVALARLMDYHLRLEDIRRTPLVSPACVEELQASGWATCDAQIDIIRRYDAEFSSLAASKREEGLSLAYVCGLDVSGSAQGPGVCGEEASCVCGNGGGGGGVGIGSGSPKVSAFVRPEWVPADHPSRAIRDINIYVQLHREGYASEHPMLLQGPGCGSSSALGIVGDILKTALKLQGATL